MGWWDETAQSCKAWDFGFGKGGASLISAPLGGANKVQVLCKETAGRRPMPHAYAGQRSLGHHPAFSMAVHCQGRPLIPNPASALLHPGKCNAVDGFMPPGWYNLDIVTAASADRCCELCKQRRGCMRWVYDAYVPTASQTANTCYLADSVNVGPLGPSAGGERGAAADGRARMHAIARLHCIVGDHQLKKQTCCCLCHVPHDTPRLACCPAAVLTGIPDLSAQGKGRSAWADGCRWLVCRHLHGGLPCHRVPAQERPGFRPACTLPWRCSRLHLHPPPVYFL